MNLSSLETRALAPDCFSVAKKHKGTVNRPPTMVIHRLIAHHFRHRDDAAFYELQAVDAIQWLERSGVGIGPGVTALDLGCGHGVFGNELRKRGCELTFADEGNHLLPELRECHFRRINIDTEDLSALGQYDLVICSNVLEHLARPERFLRASHALLKPAGHLYLSWTNWLSPWGGHEFSPFHYLGPKLGVRVYDRRTGKPRLHTPYKNLFPTYIGSILKELRRHERLEINSVVPRYYPEFALLMKIPLLREFLAWNCAVLLQRR
jgi:2-polyprenyl-3-methyl-5-hydroxy-6-metoxy-1,4-benzoquinol methylase